MNQFLIKYLGFPCLESMIQMLQELIEHEISIQDAELKVCLPNLVSILKTDIQQCVKKTQQHEIYHVLDQFSARELPAKKC